ncbi:MAG: GvpL/GvpF family gas vesicle protein [Methanothrix sp.]|nr:MAG: GvpL/GvpF family gas vesicle protein [Methanothrix sp.]
MVRRIRKAEKDVPETLGKYVYCVIPFPIKERKSFGNLGFDAREVYTMDYRDLSPVVSDVAYRDYAVDEPEVEVHRNVVEQVMQGHSVIPVAYGMAFKSKKLLQVAMSAGHQAMQKALPVVDGKVELGIKVFLPKDLEPMNSAQKEDCSADFLQSLLAVSSDNKKLKLFSDRLILNSTFLVDKSSMDEFSMQVGRLKEKYHEMKVQYSGPWPAYNFVDIHILGGKRRGFR